MHSRITVFITDIILQRLTGLILLFYEVGTKENADYYVHGMEETVRLEDIMDAMWIHFYSIYILMEVRIKLIFNKFAYYIIA